jgi:hypothetical protein
MKMDDRMKNYVRVALWSFYTLLMILVGISRLYTATHFPHQALLGLVAGSVTLVCKIVVLVCNVEIRKCAVSFASTIQTHPHLCNFRLV